MAGNGIARLRRRIAEIEGAGTAGAAEIRPGEENGVHLAPRRGAPTLPFGIPEIDGMLAGGLRRAALHEISAAESREAGAATGFAAAILARLARSDSRPILWVVEASAGHEAGDLYGTGLGSFGLDPRRLIVVTVAKPADALWVFEEALRCSGLAAVTAEIRANPRQLDLTASRRLALRARENGIMGLLLRQSNHDDAGAATTRWRVTPRPASVTDDFPAGIGLAAWRLTLERNRRGLTGTFDVEWDHDRQNFASVTPRRAALSLAAPAVSFDRPAPPPDARPLVA
jgi:protein ImuA